MLAKFKKVLRIIRCLFTLRDPGTGVEWVFTRVYSPATTTNKDQF